MNTEENTITRNNMESKQEFHQNDVIQENEKNNEVVVVPTTWTYNFIKENHVYFCQK